MTELDKLYLAMAEAGIESSFNTLCYSLGITSLSALKNYAAKPDKNIMAPSEMDFIKAKIKNKHFNFHQLAQVLSVMFYLMAYFFLKRRMFCATISQINLFSKL